jgi:hypothetical protein
MTLLTNSVAVSGLHARLTRLEIDDALLLPTLGAAVGRSIDKEVHGLVVVK